MRVYNDQALCGYFPTNSISTYLRSNIMRVQLVLSESAGNHGSTISHWKTTRRLLAATLAVLGLLAGAAGRAQAGLVIDQSTPAALDLYHPLPIGGSFFATGQSFTPALNGIDFAIFSI